MHELRIKIIAATDNRLGYRAYIITSISRDILEDKYRLLEKLPNIQSNLKSVHLKMRKLCMLL